MKGENPPYELVKLQLAERFHWTYDYIETLSIGDLADIFQTIDGRDKAAAYLRKKLKAT